MLDYVAYKTYYAIASGAEPPKSKKPKMKFDSTISFEETPSKKKPTKAKKDVPFKKKLASKLKPTKKKVDRGEGLNVLSEVALSEAAQLKEATKRSKKYFYISQESGSDNGTDFESGVPDEQQRKTPGADEGTGTKPGVPDVPKYNSESNKESWGDSGEEDDDDEDDEGNDDGDDSDENDDDADEFTDKEDDKENEEESDDGKELYKDVNVKLRQEDIEMTYDDQGRADLHNVSQQSRFEQEEKYVHVTLTIVYDTQKTEGPMQSSSVSSDFIEKLLNFKNVSPANNEIAS
nr:hypothetical protein [Tanacetum cinerariifolium]